LLSVCALLGALGVYVYPGHFSRDRTAMSGSFDATISARPDSVIEQPVSLIALAGPIADKSAQLSGMAWHGNTLVLLPQLPTSFGKGEAALYGIPKQAILDYLDGASRKPITPTAIKLVTSGVEQRIEEFGGYESIAFSGDTVFLTIEAGKFATMTGS